NRPSRSGSWRVPAGGDPHGAGDNEDGPVELEGRHGRAAGRRQADDVGPGVVPGEMGGPVFAPGVEQARDLARRGVRYGDAVVLVVVTRRTGQPEVVLDGLPAERDRGDVIELHRRTDDGLGREAVAAAVPGL